MHSEYTTCPVEPLIYAHVVDDTGAQIEPDWGEFAVSQTELDRRADRLRRLGLTDYRYVRADGACVCGCGARPGQCVTDQEADALARLLEEMDVHTDSLFGLRRCLAGCPVEAAVLSVYANAWGRPFAEPRCTFHAGPGRARRRVLREEPLPVGLSGGRIG